MSYALLSGLWLLATLAVGAACALASRTRPHLGAVAVTAAALLILTAVFDTVMIAAGFFHYPEEQLLGVHVGLAPLEDFAYPLAAAALLPVVWHILRDRDGARTILLSSRPVSWINTAFPFGATYLLAHGGLDSTWLIGTVYFLIPYNLAMYGINDVFDYASDVANPRKGGIEGALLQPHLHRRTLWSAGLSNLPFLVWLVAAGNPAAWVWLAVSVFAVIAYSAPRLRFKERPFLDSVTSSTHFVSPALVGLTLGGAEFTVSLWLVLAAFFLWGMASHAFGAVQDVGPDRQAGIGSIATVLGARTTVRLAIALWALAGILMRFSDWPGPLGALIAVPYIVNAAGWWNVSDADAAHTNRAWQRFLWLNYGCGFVATLLLILFAR